MIYLRFCINPSRKNKHKSLPHDTISSGQNFSNVFFHIRLKKLCVKSSQLFALELCLRMRIGRGPTWLPGHAMEDEYQKINNIII